MKRVESLLVTEETISNLFRLIGMLREHDSLAVLMYGAPDPDAISSAMALREIIEQKAGLSRCVFAATHPFIRQQNLEFAHAMGVDISIIDGIDLADYRLIALVDSQPPLFGEVLERYRPHIVFDHHPRTPGWHAELEDVRPRYGALSTIMTGYLLAARVRITRMLYTALLYGIRSDTNNLERDACLEDIGAYYLNFARANRGLIRRIELNQIPERYLKYFDFAYRHRHRQREKIICFLEAVENADVCVQVADFLLRIIQIYFVVVGGIVGNRLIVVFRGDGYRMNCGDIASRTFGHLGSAGGHRSAARAEIHLEKLKEILAGDLSCRNMEHFLLQSLEVKRQRLRGDGTKEKG
ncbi:MAG: phosphoesterase [Deltaproteobacteria bacterium]|nr:phosphoesterase [Deltaproteobacteria bacterium]